MRPRMADTANASASQRFTLRSRNRAALRARRLKRVAAALLPFGLLSCVGSNAVSPVEKFAAIPFRISFPDIPVIAGSPIRPIDVVDVVPVTHHIIVLGRGRIIADAPVSEILALATGTTVLVRTPDAERFGALLVAPDVDVTHSEPHLLQVTGLSAVQIGEAAASNGVVLHELSPQAGSLEDAYLALTKDEVEYHAGGVPR